MLRIEKLRDRNFWPSINVTTRDSRYRSYYGIEPTVEKTTQKIKQRIYREHAKMKKYEQDENIDHHLLRSERTELSLVVSLKWMVRHSSK